MSLVGLVHLTSVIFLTLASFQCFRERLTLFTSLWLPNYLEGEEKLFLHQHPSRMQLIHAIINVMQTNVNSKQ